MIKIADHTDQAADLMQIQCVFWTYHCHLRLMCSCLLRSPWSSIVFFSCFHFFSCLLRSSSLIALSSSSNLFRSCLLPLPRSFSLVAFTSRRSSQTTPIACKKFAILIRQVESKCLTNFSEVTPEFLKAQTLSKDEEENLLQELRHQPNLHTKNFVDQCVRSLNLYRWAVLGVLGIRL